jgi:arginine:pyruvate transaminase
MFVLIDIRATGLTGETFGERLLETEGVALMPGESFGATLGGWMRMALTQPDARTSEACARIVRFVRSGCAGVTGGGAA